MAQKISCGMPMEPAMSSDDDDGDVEKEEDMVWSGLVWWVSGQPSWAAANWFGD